MRHRPPQALAEGLPLIGTLLPGVPEAKDPGLTTSCDPHGEEGGPLLYASFLDSQEHPVKVEHLDVVLQGPGEPLLKAPIEPGDYPGYVSLAM